MRRYAIGLFTIALIGSLTATALGQAETVAVAKDRTFYADRESFLAAVGETITDDYAAYGVGAADAPLQLTDMQMSAVLSETEYEPTSFADLNLVGNVYVHGDGTNYCAGCNGNFRLHFGQTSFSRHRAVFGVALDILLHTSRHTAIGDVDPGKTSLEGTVLVEFAHGEILAFSIPADVGFFGPDPYFFGLTDRHGIKSITVGIEPLALRHRWVIDNLTIAERRKGKPN